MHCNAANAFIATATETSLCTVFHTWYTILQTKGGFQVSAGSLPFAGPHSEGSTLLLYTLLHGSRSFQEYVLVRSDPETLLVPVLQQLYQADKARANHLYMLQVRWGATCGTWHPFE
jgi:hypothetical protein